MAIDPASLFLYTDFILLHSHRSHQTTRGRWSSQQDAGATAVYTTIEERGRIYTMKRIFNRIAALALTAAMSISFAPGGYAAAAVSVTLDGAVLQGSKSAYVDGNARTQIPVELAQQMGLTATTSGTSVTLSNGPASLTLETGKQQAGTVTMDTTVVQDFVPLSYVARYFGYRLQWDSATHTAALSRPVQPSQAAVQSIQAYTDMAFYGQKLVKVAIQYAPGTDLTGIQADGSSYMLWDRGSADPTFAPVKVTSATVAPMEGVVTLTVTTDTEATTARTRNSVGALTTGAWYIGVDDKIYFGAENSAAADPITGEVFYANPSKKGYQTRENLDLILCHGDEALSDGLRLTDGVGNYTAQDKWLPTSNAQTDVFETLYLDVNDTVTKNSGKRYVAPGYTAYEGKVPVSVSLPQGYDAKQSYPLVVYVCGGGTSYWELYDAAGNLTAHNPGTNLAFDNAPLVWTQQDAIVITPHVHSNANTDAAHEVAAVIQQISAKYAANQDAIILVGNSNGTLILSETVRMYPGLGDVFFVVNGDLGGGAHDATSNSLAKWTEDELTAMAKSGLAVWFHRGETDMHIKGNQTAYQTILPYYKAAGHSDEWMRDNLRISAYMSWNFKYWGETDHSCTRLLWANFADTLYLNVYQGQSPLKPGDTYRLTGTETFDYAGAETFDYLVYGDTAQQWALSRTK